MADRTSSTLGRGVAAITLALLAAGALTTTPATGAKDGLSRKEKKQGDRRYVNLNESAPNADMLDNLDSTALQQRIHWAFVNEDGTIQTQSGGISNADEEGAFDTLRFPVSVAGKAILATAESFTSPAEATAAQVNVCGGQPEGIDCPAGINDTNHVAVAWYDPDGPFSVGYYIAVLP